MAFPWIFEENFEDGTLGNFNSETDSASQLDIPHYTELARSPHSTSAPYRGAYCARLVLSGGTADAIFLEADINIADTATNSFKFKIWFSPDFTATADDTAAILELEGSAVTGSVGFRIDGDVAFGAINMGIGSTNTGTVPNTFASGVIERGVWYTIEAIFNIETDASGTADLFVSREDKLGDKVAVASLTSVTNVAVTDGTFGIQNHAATTTGTILLDEFIQDDVQIFHDDIRHPQAPIFTKSGHVFVGPGWITGAALLTDEASNAMRLWDTDVANTDYTQGFVLEFDLNNQTAYDGALYFRRGCYVELAGTNPRGQVFKSQKNTVNR
jgi:hypothetical protein